MNNVWCSSVFWACLDELEEPDGSAREASIVKGAKHVTRLCIQSPRRTGKLLDPPDYCSIFSLECMTSGNSAQVTSSYLCLVQMCSSHGRPRPFPYVSRLIATMCGSSFLSALLLSSNSITALKPPDKDIKQHYSL